LPHGQESLQVVGSDVAVFERSIPSFLNDVDMRADINHRSALVITLPGAVRPFDVVGEPVRLSRNSIRAHLMFSEIAWPDAGCRVLASRFGSKRRFEFAFFGVDVQ
jgi:hypothetical protein